MFGDAVGSLAQHDLAVRNRYSDNFVRRRIERIVVDTHFDKLPTSVTTVRSDTLANNAADTLALTQGHEQLRLSGTGTSITTRAPRGGCRITTKSSSPANDDAVQLAGVADTNLGKADAAANGTFRIDTLGKMVFRAIVSLPSIASLFAGVGLDENITDVDPSGTAGDGVRFVAAPDNPATELSNFSATNFPSTSLYNNWMVTQKVAGADVWYPTNVPLVADRNYDLRIEIGADKKPLFFIDNNLVVPSSVWTAMTTDSQMAAMLGVEVTATTPAQKSMDIRYVGASRLFATS